MEPTVRRGKGYPPPRRSAPPPQADALPPLDGSDGQEKFADLAATVDGIVVIHQKGRCRFANKAAERILGYTQAEILKRNFWDFIHPDFQQLVQKRGLQREAGAKVPPRYEFPIVRRRGEIRWLDCSASRIEIDGTPAVLVSAIDVTPRKRLENEIIEISNDERRRLGFELHDGFGQFLGGIAFRAHLVELSLSEEHNAHATEAGEIVRLLQEALRKLFLIVNGLDLADMGSKGLVHALAQLVEETKRLFQVQCLFESNCARLPLKAEAKAHLFRIAQEAIHNSMKHGKARQVRVRLHMRGRFLRLSIQDNGSGFSLQRLPRSQGRGLRNMKVRARACGGTLEVKSSPGKGTTLQCLIPLPKTSNAPAA